jgi:hypothetical protein
LCVCLFGGNCAARCRGGGDEIHIANEVCDVAGIGGLIDVGRCCDLNDAAFVHHGDAGGDCHGFFLVVSDDNEGCAGLFLNVHQFELGVLAQLFVERAQGFIEQQEFGRLGEGPCKGDALALTAGDLMRFAAGEFFEPREFEHFCDARVDGVFGHVGAAQAEGDVLVDRQVREERVALEHHIHRAFVRRDIVHVLARDADGARGGRLETAEHAHHCGLAAAGGAEQGEEFLSVDLEGQIINGGEIAKGFGDALELDERLFGRVCPGRKHRLFGHECPSL